MNADEQILSGVNGIFVGLLSSDEIAALDRLVAQGKARRADAHNLMPQ